ncbi:hypothetical protein GCM10029978_008900 [Actinoallomurus acanthiterrae]
MVGQAHELQQQLDTALTFLRGDAGQPQRGADVLRGGQHRDQPEGLEDVSDLLPPQPGQAVLVKDGDVGSVDQNGAGVSGGPARR